VFRECVAEKVNSESVNSLPKSMKSPVLLLTKLPENEFMLVLPALLANEKVAELDHSEPLIIEDKKRRIMKSAGFIICKYPFIWDLL
jgi:hypothetical protein